MYRHGGAHVVAPGGARCKQSRASGTASKLHNNPHWLDAPSPDGHRCAPTFDDTCPTRHGPDERAGKPRRALRAARNRWWRHRRGSRRPAVGAAGARGAPAGDRGRRRSPCPAPSREAGAEEPREPEPEEEAESAEDAGAEASAEPEQEESPEPARAARKPAARPREAVAPTAEPEPERPPAQVDPVPGPRARAQGRRARAGPGPDARAASSPGSGEVFAGKKQIDPSVVDEIEKVLLTADIGVRTSQKLLEEIRARCRAAS